MSLVMKPVTCDITINNCDNLSLLLVAAKLLIMTTEASEDECNSEQLCSENVRYDNRPAAFVRRCLSANVPEPSTLSEVHLSSPNSPQERHDWFARFPALVDPSS